MLTCFLYYISVRSVFMQLGAGSDLQENGVDHSIKAQNK